MGELPGISVFCRGADGQVFHTYSAYGVGADVMGDPLRPLWWLAEQRRQWGDGLRAGETISTGSMTGMLPIRGGQHVRARFGEAATIEITIDL